MNPEAARPCQVCDGCGRVADTADMEPWTEIEDRSIVRPKPCPRCKARPRVRRKNDHQWVVSWQRKFYVVSFGRRGVVETMIFASDKDGVIEDWSGLWAIDRYDLDEAVAAIRNGEAAGGRGA